MSHLDEGTIHAWLDGALAADEARQAEAHVAGCAACADAVAEARGLIAASSMILSKLDGVMPERDAQPAIPDLSMRDIAVARAEAAVRPRPGVRRWFAGSPMRAAAAVLILAGGVAVVGNVTSRDELAGVVADAAMESEARGIAESGDGRATSSAAGNATVARDATAAEVEREETPPPPTVAAAPQLPPSMPAAGPVRRQAAPTEAARASGGIAGRTALGGGGGLVRPTVRVGSDSSPTAAVSAEQAGVGAAAEEQGGVRRLEERLRRVEQPAERDFSEAAKAAASAPPPAAPTQAAPLAESMRLPDSTLALQSARRATEQVPLRQSLAAQAPAAPSGRLARSEAAATEQPAALLAPRCYALTLAPWSPVTAPAPVAPFTRLFLAPDTGIAGAASGQRLVRPMPGESDGAYAAAWWTEVSPSTLVLTWATGSEGIVMRLVRSGSDLAGTARTFGTAGGVERTSNVTGTAVDCGEVR